MAATTSSAFSALRHTLLAALALVSVIPFSSRAVFMDEHIFLKIAQTAQTQWLFPQDTPGLFFGTTIPDFASHTHPPVGEYCLALIYAALGRFEEAPFRLLFGFFPLLALYSFYSLARRFAAEPLYLTALFGLSPAFFMYAPTLMMDVPMVAFMLAGFALYFRAIDGERWALPAASALLTLAVGTGYTALIPVSSLFISMLAARRSATELAALAAAPAALALWLLAMTVHFGRFPLIATAQYVISQGSIPWNLIAVFTFMGGVTIFPFTSSGRLLVPVLAVLATALFGLSWPGMARPLWVVMLAVSGGMVLKSFLMSARKLLSAGRNHGEAFLLLWVPATLIFFVIVGDMINGRYILLATPAVFLVTFRETSKRQLAKIMIATGLLSAALAYADMISVNANREFVAMEVMPLLDQGEEVLGGAESGLRFYLEQRGIQSLSAQATGVAEKKLIVRHAGFPFRYGLSAAVESCLIVRKRFTLTSAFPLRTFNAPAGAGFHDSRLGLAPFTFARDPFDRIQIEEVCLPKTVRKTPPPR